MPLELIRTVDFVDPNGAETVLEVSAIRFDDERLAPVVAVHREGCSVMLHDAEHMRRVIRAMVAAGKRLGWDIETDEIDKGPKGD